jgi:hypothetical protein
MTADLTTSVNGLYETFAAYPRPKRIDYCRCGCTKPAELEPLLARPLHELRFSDLSSYSFSAMTTQGSVDDFRYLLPRLFEGVVTKPYGYNCEILFGKLDYAKWLDWPLQEVAAIRTFLHALWGNALDSFPLETSLPAFFEIETVVASIAVTGDDLRPYLSVWDQAQTREANEHLIQMVTIYGMDFSAEGAFRTGFWAKAQPQADTLLKWLIQPMTLQRVRENAFLLRQDGFEHLFELSFAALQSLAEERTQ